MNLCFFFFYSIIGKLTDFLEFQEFSLCNLHYRRVVFSSQLKSKVGNILVKVVSLRITLNI
jgi:hypothetical protein